MVHPRNKNTYLQIIILALVFLSTCPAQANGETLRCVGSFVNTRNDFEKRINIYIDIVIPDKNAEDYILTLGDKENGNFKSVISPTPLVKKTFLDVTKSLDKGSKQKPERYDFIITKMPDRNNSLVGFVYGFEPWILKVDTWKANKPFILFQTGFDDLIQGECIGEQVRTPSEVNFVGFDAEQPYQDSFAQAARLAEKGDPEGQYQLGKHFDFRWGVKRDPYQAAEWYEKAAKQRHVEAQHALGLLNTEAGNYPLANVKESVKWFRAAAEQAHASSEYFLGNAYEEGKGVTRSYEEAAKWYERAGMHGNGMGMHGFATLCARGLGVKKNLIIAYAWSSVAATQHWGMAVSYREELEKLMTPDQIKEAQRLSVQLHKKYGEENRK